jgi:hypothetical protein
MLVSEMLDYMSLLSVGPDIAPSDVRSIYLKYLNLSHFKLYNYTSIFNDDLKVIEKLTTTFDEDLNNTTVVLSQKPFNISKVYYADKRRYLVKKCFDDFYDYQDLNTLPASPQVFMSQKRILSIYPFVPTENYLLTIRYTPQAFNLTESMEEDDIPYPVPYHQLLVDGGLYYLFKDEEGFQSTQKGKDHQVEWETGKTQLFSYLYNTYGNEIGTFTNV